MSNTHTSSVILDVRPGESIKVGDTVLVQLLRKSGNHSRLRVTAPRELAIKHQNTEADHAPSMADCQPS